MHSTKKPGVPRRLSISRAIAIAVFVATFLSLTSFHSRMHFFPPTYLKMWTEPPFSSSLQCVFIPNAFQSHEGIGALMHRNQVALFIASWYNTAIEYHGIPSIHGYDVNHMFGKCPGPKLPQHDKDGAISKHPCTLDLSNIYIPVCELQDCKCLGKAIEPHVDKLVAKSCSSIIVLADGFKHTAFSACVKPVLQRYFGWTGPKPTWQYDVIHYRMGDLADRPGGKSFAPETLQAFVDVMCKTSKRDIVILTEGNPDVPQCEDRVVLAADTSIKEAMQIMQFGKKVAVGRSSFAKLMMMMANPEAVILRTPAYEYYDWVDVDEWFLMELDYAFLHYTSKEILRKHLRIHSDLRVLKFRAQRDIVMNFAKAKRRWKSSMMK